MSRSICMLVLPLLAGCAASPDNRQPVEEPRTPADVASESETTTPGWPEGLPALDPENPHTWPLPMLWYETPVPDYESPGNGYAQSEIEMGGRRFVGVASFVGNGPGLEHVFDGTDLQDDTGATTFSLYSLVPDDAVVVAPAAAVSRNHPTYTVAGRVAATGLRHDFVAIIHHDRPDVALVNLRLFDLANGRVIIVVPHQDGSVRYLQQPIGLLPAPDIDDPDAFNAAITPLLDTTELRTLLADPGVITP
ncbi:MAG: hypothetical protein AAGH64_02820 [Planctomycetota bacterium]